MCVFEFVCVYLNLYVCTTPMGHRNQGEADVSRHINGAKHKETIKSASSSRRLSEVRFRTENDPTREQVRNNLLSIL